MLQRTAQASDRGEPDNGKHVDEGKEASASVAAPAAPSSPVARGSDTPFDSPDAADTPVDTGFDMEPEEHKTITFNLENLPPGSKVQLSVQTPGSDQLFDPADVRDEAPQEPKASESELPEIESGFRNRIAQWNSMPATLKAGVVALPIELASVAAPGIYGMISGVAGMLVMIPGVIADYRSWRKGDKK